MVLTAAPAIINIQLVINPKNAPWVYLGYLAKPPAAGIIAPSSAYTNAMRITANPLINQENIDAGPAYLALIYMPNSQPEPIIALVEANVNCNKFKDFFIGLI